MRHLETLWVTLSHFESLWVTGNIASKRIDLNSICLKQSDRNIALLILSKIRSLQKSCSICPIYIWVNQNKDVLKKYILFVSSIFESPWIKISKRYILFVSCVFESAWIDLFFWSYSIWLIHRENLKKEKVETMWMDTSLFQLSHTLMPWKLLDISKPVTQLNQLKLWVFLRSSNIESNGIKTKLRHCE